MRAWLYLLRGQVLGIFLEVSSQHGPGCQKAFRRETLGRASFHVRAFWLELRSNRFAPDSAPLRCAAPGVSSVTLGRWRPSARNAGGSIPLTTTGPSGGGGHLDTMWFTASIQARTPRADCLEHGLKTMQVPWAAPQGRCMLLFGSARRRGRGQRAPGFNVRCRRLPAPANWTAPSRPSYLNKPAFSGPLGDRYRSQPGRTRDVATLQCGRKSSAQSLNTVRKMMSEH